MSETILSVVVGSVGYGLDTDGSDTDRLEVYVEPTTNLVSLNPPGDCSVGKDSLGDVTRWEVGKFLRLALKGNPAALELLWTGDEHVMRWTEGGKALRAMRQSFISSALYGPYRGFCQSQYNRMVKDGRSSHGHKIPPGQTYDYKAATHCLRLLYQGRLALQTGTLLVDMRAYPEYGFLKAVRAGEVAFGAVRDRIADGLVALEEAYQQTTLPPAPATELVNDWLVALRINHLVEPVWSVREIIRFGGGEKWLPVGPPVD